MIKYTISEGTPSAFNPALIQTKFLCDLELETLHLRWTLTIDCDVYQVIGMGVEMNEKKEISYQVTVRKVATIQKT